MKNPLLLSVLIIIGLATLFISSLILVDLYPKGMLIGTFTVIGIGGIYYLYKIIK